MTILASEPPIWSEETWAAREASGNPVWPFEWEVHYQRGGVFKRLCAGRARTSRDAPLEDVRALRVYGPGVGVLEILPEPGPVLALVIRARVVGLLAAPARRGVAAWIFGFHQASGFVGLTLDASGAPVRDTPSPPINGGGP